MTHYWMFAGACALIGLVLLRLVLREHVTLQASLAFFLLLIGGAAIAVEPRVLAWVTRQLGFELPSNLLFAICLGALAVLHVLSLVTLSRVELRSIALTQEVALLQEQVQRLADRGEAAPVAKRQA